MQTTRRALDNFVGTRAVPIRLKFVDSRQSEAHLRRYRRTFVNGLILFFVDKVNRQSESETSRMRIGNC